MSKKIGMLSVLLSLLLAAVVAAQGQASVSFVNASGDDATVRLVGPTGVYVSVPDRSRWSVAVSGGTYYIVTRYGQPGNYRYSRGGSFTVESAPGEEIEITLHRVANGNYSSRPASEREFQ